MATSEIINPNFEEKNNKRSKGGSHSSPCYI